MFANVDPNSFLNTWPLTKTTFRNYLEKEMKTGLHTDYAEEIEDILVLLRLLPSNVASKKYIETVENFEQAIKELIIYVPVTIS